MKKLAQEDANDPHKSLDFGMAHSKAALDGRKKCKKGGPEMMAIDPNNEKMTQRPRGLSMDMDMGSPYVLPPGLHGSRESLHSLTRTMHSNDDRYRPATTFVPNDSGSMRSYHTTPRAADDSSSFADSGSSGRGYGQDNMRQDLLRDASRMSRSVPPTSRTLDPSSNNVPQINTPEPSLQIPRKASPSSPQGGGLAPMPGLDSRDSYLSRDGGDLRKSNNYLGPLIHSRDPSADLQSPTSSPPPQQQHANPPPTLQQTINRKSPPPVIGTASENVIPPRKQSLHASSRQQSEINFLDDESDYGDAFKVTPPSPSHNAQPPHTAPIPETSQRSSQEPMPAIDEHSYGYMDTPDLGYDIRRLSMGVRPLPPDDPTDNPEMRANRIRSFYKEYFDDSKPAPQAQQYYEDYDQDYLEDAAIFDPATNQFVVAQPDHQEPYGRRAMTPPPRAPPRFRGRHQATMSSASGGRLMPPGPRAFSSMSGRLGPPRGPPKKRLPPPGPLRVLPTPHLLKEDSFALPIDFAPPTNYKDRQAGRPESPRGGLRPYSPALSAHVPLASSFDDLSVMPSP